MKRLRFRMVLVCVLMLPLSVHAQTADARGTDAETPEPSLNGFLVGFDVMGGVERYRGAHRNGALRIGIRLRPLAALGFDFGFGVAFLGHQFENQRLGGAEGSIHLDVRSYLYGHGDVQPFVVGGLRYGRFFASNAEAECPSVHGGPTEPLVKIDMSFYDVSAGFGIEIPLHSNVAVVWDVRGMRRASVRGAEFHIDALNEPTSPTMWGWSSQLALVATASPPAPPPTDPKTTGWW